MNQPLAERLRPKNIEEFVGQSHLVGKDTVFRKAMDSGVLPSIVLWGPPGVGKTTVLTRVANTAYNLGYNVLDILSKNFYGLYIYYRILKLKNYL